MVFQSLDIREPILHLPKYHKNSYTWRFSALSLSTRPAIARELRRFWTMLCIFLSFLYLQISNLNRKIEVRPILNNRSILDSPIRIQDFEAWVGDWLTVLQGCVTICLQSELWIFVDMDATFKLKRDQRTGLVQNCMSPYQLYTRFRILTKDGRSFEEIAVLSVRDPGTDFQSTDYFS